MFFNLKNFMMCLALAAAGVSSSMGADSLSVSPSNPTTSDSIKLSIVMKSWDCCARFLYDPTQVVLSRDSVISLGFIMSTPVVDTLCCVPGPIPVLNFRRGPLAVGTYTVYEEPQSCVGTICSDVIPVIRIGTFTVTRPNSITYEKKSLPLEDAGKMSGSVRVYNIRGDIVSLSRTGASKRSPGVYFVKPIGRSVAKMKVWF